MEAGGYGRPNADNELPIDTNYQKPFDWLVRVTGRIMP